MAVIQISRIQQRRGKKNSTSGVPQLSSAELAWAVDTQELYIGNGSVAEGAPYVGNTRILTEHENILLYAAGYTYADDDNSITGSVPRNIQSKLDEYVSVLDFGAVGDNLTDNTTAFQLALNQLFRNTDTSKHKVLVVPNGIYKISNDLKIPSNTSIRGETADNVVLDIGTSTVSLVSFIGTQSGSFDSADRPINIKLSNLTIKRTSGQLDLTGAKFTNLEDVKFIGNSVFDTDYSDSSVPLAAVYWQNEFVGIATTNLTFKNCSFESISAAVRCTQLGAFKTEVIFDNCEFTSNYNCIDIDGYTKQESAWLISNCRFNEIFNHAFYSNYGSGTVVQNSVFTACGNGTNSAAYPLAPIVYFGEKINNTVVGCRCDRQQAISNTVSSSTMAIPAVVNANVAEFIDFNSHDIIMTNSNVLTVFSTLNRYIKVGYTLTLGNYTRTGILNISVDDLYTNVSIGDQYEYSQSSITSTGSDAILGFEFDVVIKDNDTNSENDTILLLYKNPPATGEVGTITYTVTYGV